MSERAIGVADGLPVLAGPAHDADLGGRDARHLDQVCEGDEERAGRVQRHGRIDLRVVAERRPQRLPHPGQARIRHSGVRRCPGILRPRHPGAPRVLRRPASSGAPASCAPPSELPGPASSPPSTPGPASCPASEAWRRGARVHAPLTTSSTAIAHTVRTRETSLDPGPPWRHTHVGRWAGRREVPGSCGLTAGVRLAPVEGVRTSPLSHSEEAAVPVLRLQTPWTPRPAARASPSGSPRSSRNACGRGSPRAVSGRARRSGSCSSSPWSWSPSCGTSSPSCPGTPRTGRCPSRGRWSSWPAGASESSRWRSSPRLAARLTASRPDVRPTRHCHGNVHPLSPVSKGAAPVKRTDLVEMENLGPVYYWQGVPAPRAGDPVPGPTEPAAHRDSRARGDGRGRGLAGAVRPTRRSPRPTPSGPVRLLTLRRLSRRHVHRRAAEGRRSEQRVHRRGRR